MYKVLNAFADAMDGGYLYEEGSTYPREGLKPSKERIVELSCERNLAGIKLIEAVKRTKKED